MPQLHTSCMQERCRLVEQPERLEPNIPRTEGPYLEITGPMSMLTSLKINNGLDGFMVSVPEPSDGEGTAHAALVGFSKQVETSWASCSCCSRVLASLNSTRRLRRAALRGWHSSRAEPFRLPVCCWLAPIANKPVIAGVHSRTVQGYLITRRSLLTSLLGHQPHPSCAINVRAARCSPPRQEH
jgi:hypothetical protein